MQITNCKYIMIPAYYMRKINTCTNCLNPEIPVFNIDGTCSTDYRRQMVYSPVLIIEKNSF